MSSLIDLLNKHSQLTPDQIVSQLNSPWIHWGSISQTLWEEWQAQRLEIVIVHMDHHGQWYLNGTSFSATSWSYDSITNDGMDMYWVRPAEGYVHGDFPDRDAERQRRQIS